MHQTQLFTSDYERAQAFKDFHLSNPHIYQALLRAAERLRARGVRRWGLRNLWEKLRYDLAIGVMSLEEVEFVDENGEHQTKAVKLNDHYPPYFARLMIRDYPERYEGWLEVRGVACVLPDGV